MIDIEIHHIPCILSPSGVKLFSPFSCFKTIPIESSILLVCSPLSPTSLWWPAQVSAQRHQCYTILPALTCCSPPPASVTLRIHCKVCHCPDNIPLWPVSFSPFTGNHEIEAQEDANLTIFASVQARWKVSTTLPSNSISAYSMSKECEFARWNNLWCYDEPYSLTERLTWKATNYDEQFRMIILGWTTIDAWFGYINGNLQCCCWSSDHCCICGKALRILLPCMQTGTDHVQVPSVASGSNSYFFHSIEYGPVHSISLSVYVNYLPGLSLGLLNNFRTSVHVAQRISPHYRHRNSH